MAQSSRKGPRYTLDKMKRQPTGRRRIKPFLAASVCAALTLASPGLDCYAASAVIIAPAAAGPGAAAAGAAGRGASAVPNLSISAAPIPPLLSAPTLTAGIPVLSAVPLAGLLPSIAPAAAPQTLAAPSRPASAPAKAAPAKTSDSAPAAHIALEAGARRLAEARTGDGAARRSALETMFTGARRAGEGGSPVSGAASARPGLRLLPAPSEGPHPARTSPSSLSDSAAASAPGLDKVRVFISRADPAPGEIPASVPLAELGKALAADPALKGAVNRSGRIRVVLSKSAPAGGLTKEDVVRIEKSLRAGGVTAKLEIENISIDWNRASGAPASEARSGTSSTPESPAAPNGVWRRAAAIAAAPFREAAYLARTFTASFTTPTFSAVVAGVVMKLVIPLVVLRQAGWVSQYAGHPVAMALALGFSVSINLFHGVWVGTWANFQNSLGKQRGLNYQAAFNFVYGQFLGVVSRIIAWSAISGTVPPWSYRYWKDVGIMAVVGTFFGTLGYQGINTLYNNGRLSQRWRDGIFLFRDLAMNLAGYFFGSGSMTMFWGMFIAQQAMDLGIYALSRKIERRTILYVADEAVSSSPEFQLMYPVGPHRVEESPLKQAWKNVVGSPFVKPVVWIARKLRGIFESQKS